MSPTPPKNPFPAPKSNKPLIFSLVVLILTLLASTSFLTYQNYQLRHQLTQVQTAPAPILNSNPTANWKIYTDTQIGYTIKYPPEMIPSKGNCDSFILPASKKERETIQSIKKQGIEIGYSIDGLELSFCVMANPNKLDAENFAKKHSPDTSFEPINLNNYRGVKSLTRNSSQKVFVEMFLNAPANKIVRIWYRHGKSEYQEVINQILSTFKFLE